MSVIETKPLPIDLIKSTLLKHGLQVRGVLSQSDLNELNCGIHGCSLVLVGNVGSAVWPSFVRSFEYADGQANPMDRWSRRVGEQLGAKLNDSGIGTRVLFPFDGPPYVPFQKLAAKADVVQPSALGILIHPQYGLWQAYRFALVLDVELQAHTKEADVTSLCNNCEAKPCLNACPVGAFTEQHYDLKTCVNYLADNPEAACLTNGCIARHACPEGPQYHYTSAHAKFHMRAFLDAHIQDRSIK